jgi:two-component system, LytTR family, sensor histidine kinase AlgZ
MPSNRPHSPLDTLWQAPSMLSVVFIGEAVAALLALAPGFIGDRWVYFGLASLMIQWIILVTMGLLFVLRLRLSSMKPIRVSWIALVILVTTSGIIACGAWKLMGIGLTRPDVSLPIFLVKVLAIALLVGMLSLAAFQNHWQARQLAVKAKQAELEALTARIRPHFLFNTLNAGASLVHGRPEEAERLLLNLADLFRAALSGQQEISLEDELDLAKGYVEIELLRFNDRLNIQWDLPSPLPAITVPALSIQPLIENAIKHGMEPSSVRVNVEVIVKLQAGNVSISVLNDMPKNKPAVVSGHQVGLLSSRERIRALSRGRAELETRIKNDRFIAVITLPTDEEN